MNGLSIPGNSLLKSVMFVCLFGFIVLGAVGGCSDNNGGQNNTRALTENDFANDPSLRVDPEKNLVVHFLEHPDSEKPENDTGEVGNDRIPFRYTSTVEHTFCWEDDDGEAGHFMELNDVEGNEILRLDVNGECITEVIEAGHYLMHIHHDGRIERSHSIFIIPNPEDNGQASETKGLIERFNIMITSIFKAFTKTIYSDAYAQKSNKVLNTLITTNACPNCDLSGVDLTGANLIGADLSGANLSDTILTDALLTSANLSGADITVANLSQADLTSADLTGADLTSADLTGADLIGADLTSADLISASLIGADLTGAELTNAILSNAILLGTDLTSANLTASDLTNTILIVANFSLAILANANLTQANAHNMLISNGMVVDLTGANFNFADLSNAKLTSANLTNANLSGASLNATDLSGAIFKGVNLTDANLTGSNLTGTDLNSATWCDGICMCDIDSKSMCLGCAPVEEVCTGF